DVENTRMLHCVFLPFIYIKANASKLPSIILRHSYTQVLREAAVKQRGRHFLLHLLFRRNEGLDYLFRELLPDERNA
ncbi:MAG TPA: hypothetical protein PKU68_02450, partial [Bacillota bacterium]|nr:hypothetical protein [Bacillota bacterium]